ncbi:hypothetical protein EV121DRAFT_218490 [Schizophyllum commune]
MSKKGRDKSASTQDFDLSSLRRGQTIRRSAQSQRLSQDERRRQVKEVELPPPQKRRRLSTGGDGSSRPPLPPDAFDAGPDDADPELQEPGVHPIGASGQPWKRKYYIASDEPLREFTKFVDEFMEEMMRADGRGDAASHACPGCTPGEERPAVFRCTSCTGLSMYCSECILRVHGKRPFCKVEEWKDDCFHPRSLASLGLVLQLCHPDGELCSNRTLAANDFTVIDINGFHHVPVYQCGCPNAPPLRQQLLRHRLFPATPTAPRTACTFSLLEHFHLLTLHGKVTTYDFYNALEKMSDSLGIAGLKDRYRVFIRCVREWRCLKILKRGGRGNDILRKPTNFTPGELAVRCPACPIPGENLPEGWQNVPSERKYLYFLAIALDACFRLKRRQVSSEAKDPRLLDGAAYIVERAPFDQWIKNADKQDDTTSSCTGLSALERANTKFSKGYAETGKGIGVCARHEFVQPNGVVPLQVGER